jgi:tetratricopeptide (TPR) repeat protein
MQRLLWGVFIVILSLPLLFAGYLFVAARSPALDRITLRLPMDVRSPVAQIALRSVGYGKGSSERIDRILQLDPENAVAWTRRCSNQSSGSVAERLGNCKRAATLDPSRWNFNRLGLIQQEAKDFCAAEESFTIATTGTQRSTRSSAGMVVSLDGNEPNAIFLRNMGIAAVRCGHIPAGRAGLEVAEDLDEKSVAKDAADPESDDDDVDDDKADLALDREYLAAVYDQVGEPVKAAEACSKAHVGWTPCHCELTDKAVACSKTPSADKPNQQARGVRGQ